MTRETKIGLLVGLAFIIVVGILLSDHFRTTMEPSQAMLDRAGFVVRQAINSPGSGQVSLPADPIPQEVSPRVPVQTQRDLEPTPSPITIVPNTNNPDAAAEAADPPAHTPSDADANHVPPLAADTLTDAARQQGLELVNADQPANGTTSISPTTPAAPVTPVRLTTRSYKAVPGDTVSRLAARFLGANTHANRQAIIDANPVLKANADRIIVGHAYLIPAKAAPANVQTASAQPAPDTTPAPADAHASPAASALVYVVKPGDTLWKIARTEVGDPAAIPAIEELNPSLHGGTNVRVGMKLHLPGKTVAAAT